MCVHVSLCECVCVHICACVGVNACTRVHMCQCVNVCVHVYVFRLCPLARHPSGPTGSHLDPPPLPAWLRPPRMGEGKLETWVASLWCPPPSGKLSPTLQAGLGAAASSPGLRTGEPCTPEDPYCARGSWAPGHALHTVSCPSWRTAFPGALPSTLGELPQSPATTWTSSMDLTGTDVTLQSLTAKGELIRAPPRPTAGGKGHVAWTRPSAHPGWPLSAPPVQISHVCPECTLGKSGGRTGKRGS